MSRRRRLFCAVVINYWVFFDSFCDFSVFSAFCVCFLILTHFVGCQCVDVLIFGSVGVFVGSDVLVDNVVRTRSIFSFHNIPQIKSDWLETVLMFSVDVPCHDGHQHRESIVQSRRLVEKGFVCFTIFLTEVEKRLISDGVWDVSDPGFIPLPFRGSTAPIIKKSNWALASKFLMMFSCRFGDVWQPASGNHFTYSWYILIVADCIDLFFVGVDMYYCRRDCVNFGFVCGVRWFCWVIVSTEIRLMFFFFFLSARPSTGVQLSFD
jgi:hypothetical protein